MSSKKISLSQQHVRRLANVVEKAPGMAVVKLLDEYIKRYPAYAIGKDGLSFAATASTKVRNTGTTDLCRFLDTTAAALCDVIVRGSELSIDQVEIYNGSSKQIYGKAELYPEPFEIDSTTGPDQLRLINILVPLKTEFIEHLALGVAEGNEVFAKVVATFSATDHSLTGWHFAEACVKGYSMFTLNGVPTSLVDSQKKLLSDNISVSGVSISDKITLRTALSEQLYHHEREHLITYLEQSTGVTYEEEKESDD